MAKEATNPKPSMQRERYCPAVHSKAAADSKNSPMNPVTCIVLHLENIRLGRIIMWQATGLAGQSI